MRNILITFGFMLIGLAVYAQPIDCPATLSSRTAPYPYSVSELSQSMQCYTGKKYEYDYTLLPGKEYRIMFFASSIFDNNMTFQIKNAQTGEVLMSRPGETKENKKGESVLRDYMDYVTGKMTYPSFDFVPEKNLNLKIAINIPVYKYRIKTHEADGYFVMEDVYEEVTENRKGCLTIFIQEIVSEEYVKVD